MSQKKINSYFDNSQKDYSVISYPKRPNRKEMPWCSSQTRNPVVHKYHSHKRDLNSMKPKMKPYSSFSRAYKTVYNSKEDSQGGVYPFSSQSQDSLLTNQIQSLENSMEPSEGNYSYDLTSYSQSKNHPNCLLKRELRQMTQVYLNSENQQEKQLMEQVAEDARNTRQELMKLKDEDTNMKQTLLGEIENLNKNQQAASACQFKLLESIKEVSTSSLVTSQSKELQNCVQGIKENMKDGLKGISNQLEEVLKQFSDKSNFKCDVGTQYSPQITSNQARLYDVTDSMKHRQRKRTRSRDRFSDESSEVPSAWDGGFDFEPLSKRDQSVPDDEDESFSSEGEDFDLIFPR